MQLVEELDFIIGSDIEDEVDNKISVYKTNEMIKKQINNKRRV